MLALAKAQYEKPPDPPLPVVAGHPLADNESSLIEAEMIRAHQEYVERHHPDSHPNYRMHNWSMELDSPFGGTSSVADGRSEQDELTFPANIDPNQALPQNSTDMEYERDDEDTQAVSEAEADEDPFIPFNDPDLFGERRMNHTGSGLVDWELFIVNGREMADVDVISNANAVAENNAVPRLQSATSRGRKRKDLSSLSAGSSSSASSSSSFSSSSTSPSSSSSSGSNFGLGTYSHSSSPSSTAAAAAVTAVVSLPSNCQCMDSDTECSNRMTTDDSSSPNKRMRRESSSGSVPSHYIQDSDHIDLSCSSSSVSNPRILDVPSQQLPPNDGAGARTYGSSSYSAPPS